MHTKQSWPVHRIHNAREENFQGLPRIYTLGYFLKVSLTQQLPPQGPPISAHIQGERCKIETDASIETGASIETDESY